MAVSRIKPHLRLLSSSALSLDEAVVERTVQRETAALDTAPPDKALSST